MLDLIGEGAEVRGVDGVRTGRVHAEALAGHGIGERYMYIVVYGRPGVIIHTVAHISLRESRTDDSLSAFGRLGAVVCVPSFVGWVS